MVTVLHLASSPTSTISTRSRRRSSPELSCALPAVASPAGLLGLRVRLAPLEKSPGETVGPQPLCHNR